MREFELAADLYCFHEELGAEDNFLLMSASQHNLAVRAAGERVLDVGDIILSEITPCYQRSVRADLPHYRDRRAAAGDPRKIRHAADAMREGWPRAAPGDRRRCDARHQRRASRKAGYGDYCQPPYMRVRGHGLGITSDRPGDITDRACVLEEGMVFVMHPNQYHPETGYLMCGEPVVVSGMAQFAIRRQSCSMPYPSEASPMLTAPPSSTLAPTSGTRTACRTTSSRAARRARRAIEENRWSAFWSTAMRASMLRSPFSPISSRGCGWAWRCCRAKGDRGFRHQLRATAGDASRPGYRRRALRHGPLMGEGVRSLVRKSSAVIQREQKLGTLGFDIMVRRFTPRCAAVSAIASRCNAPTTSWATPIHAAQAAARELTTSSASVEAGWKPRQKPSPTVPLVMSLE